MRKRGIHDYRIVASDGALELHPSLGIADIIVDLTSSGVTLKDNRLRELMGGKILESAACLIGHSASLRSLAAEGPSAPLALLLDSIDAVRLAEGRVQLDVTGTFPDSVDKQAAYVEKIFTILAAHGATRLAWQPVGLEAGQVGWHISGLTGTRGLTSCRRALIDLGASAILGLNPRLCLDQDDHSTFETLRHLLSHSNHAG